MGQQWLLICRLCCLRNERAAVAVGHGDETRSHVIAEQRKLRDVGSVF